MHTPIEPGNDAITVLSDVGGTYYRTIAFESAGRVYGGQWRGGHALDAMSREMSAPLGVVRSPDHAERASADPLWTEAVPELLDHTRVPYSLIDLDGSLPAVVLFPAPPRLDGTELARIEAHLVAGGAVVACGGPGDLAPLAGVDAGAEVTQARVLFRPAAAWDSGPDVALRAFGGVHLLPRPRVGRPDDQAGGPVSVLAQWLSDDGGPVAPAITLSRHGAGHCLVIGADLAHTLVRIQQGWPIWRDGRPPPDGTSPVDDGVLKVDDGIALSYTDDRGPTPGAGPLAADFTHTWPPTELAPYFHRPHADLWRHVLLRVLWWLADRTGTALPWLGYWPAGVPAVLHLSHDTDGNSDDDAQVALDAFAAAGVRATWCVLPPGDGPAYSPGTFGRMIAAGHEIGLHFDAHSPGRAFSEVEFVAQLAWVREATGAARVHTNKNHYLRWEGFAEFYRWCEEQGVQVEETRGPGTQGNVGFPFGTCHPAYPLDAAGRRIPVLTLPLHFQDLAWTVQPRIRDAVLGQVLAHHGVLHCLFHGANLRISAETRDALAETVATAAEVGMPCWTGAQIGEWERTRRGVRIATREDGDGLRIDVYAEMPLAGAAILVPLPGRHGLPQVTGAPCRAAMVTRHGLPHLEIGLDLPAGYTSLEARGRT